MASTNIYTGFWIDWELGLISGTTLTTSSVSGFYLVAFLTLYVRAVGGHFWSILCYIVHQVQCDKEDRDALHYQSQALLRNSHSTSTYLWSLTELIWAWRGKAQRLLGRTLLLYLMAILQIATFGLVAFFSSRIASNSRSVLIDNERYCGYYGNNVSNIDFMVNSRRTAEWALNYARECYVDGVDSSLCNTFTTQRFELPTESVSCPFEDTSICLPTQEGALQMDTGYLNSLKHFGINSKHEDSFDYRKITTCTPLTTEGYISETVNDGSSIASLEGDSIYSLHYGPRLSGGTNATFQYTWNQWLTSNKAYYLSYAAAYAQGVEYSDSDDFSPIPALKIENTDINLIMLLNCAEYTGRVSDSWFYAQEEFEDNSTKVAHVRYYAWPPASIMSCIVQHQVCSVEPRSCSPLIGLSQLKEYNLTRDGSVLEAIWYYFLRAVSNSDLDYMVGTLGSATLQAEANVSYAQRLFSAPLPDLQWQTEVFGWVQFTLSNVQRLLYQFADGPSDLSLSSVMTKPPHRDVFDVCHAQKIKNSDYYCFSVLGLVFTLAMGLLIIVVNLSLPHIVGRIQRRTGKEIYKNRQWVEDHVLHIQRLAYQNLGIGNWHGHDHAVPTTDAEEVVGRPTKIEHTSTSSTIVELKTHGTSVTTDSVGGEYSPVYGYQQANTYVADGVDSARVQAAREDRRPFLPRENMGNRGQHIQHDLWVD